MTPHTPVETPSTLLTRRTALRTAAWSVPAVTVITAAPAYAATSTDPWTITSSSWEGEEGGARYDSGWIVFRFTIAIPAGATIPSPTASFSTQAVGSGCTITGLTNDVNTTTVGDWAVTATTRGRSADSYQSFTFTQGDIVGPAVVTLNFTLEGASSGSNPDIPPEGLPFTFSSGSSITGPTTTFTVLGKNLPTEEDPAGYITVPA